MLHLHSRHQQLIGTIRNLKTATKKQTVGTSQPSVASLSPEGSYDAALAHLRAADPVLASIIQRAGAYAIQYHEPTFRALVRSIVFQQLHGKSARTLSKRESASAYFLPASSASAIPHAGRIASEMSPSDTKVSWL